MLKVERPANKVDRCEQHPMGFREIPLTRGLVALVDAADYAELSQYRWRATSTKGRNTCYAARREAGKTVLMHRQIMATPAGMCTDHINGDGLHNRRANLRVCTNAENLQNRRTPKNNTSGFKGVSDWGNCYMAKVAGVYLGTFRSRRQAALAYDDAAKRLYGEFANLNFPEAS